MVSAAKRIATVVIGFAVLASAPFAGALTAETGSLSLTVIVSHATTTTGHDYNEGGILYGGTGAVLRARPSTADTATGVGFSAACLAYDDLAHLAYTNALGASGFFAPQTAGLADDIPAFARSQYGRPAAAARAWAFERAPTHPCCGQALPARSSRHGLASGLGRGRLGG